MSLLRWQLLCKAEICHRGPKRRSTKSVTETDHSPKQNTNSTVGCLPMDGNVTLPLGYRDSHPRFGHSFIRRAHKTLPRCGGEKFGRSVGGSENLFRCKYDMHMYIMYDIVWSSMYMYVHVTHIHWTSIVIYTEPYLWSWPLFWQWPEEKWTPTSVVTGNITILWHREVPESQKSTTPNMLTSFGTQIYHSWWISQFQVHNFDVPWWKLEAPFWPLGYFIPSSFPMSHRIWTSNLIGWMEKARDGFKNIHPISTSPLKTPMN